MTDQAVLFEVRDSIARITLNRPEQSNAFDLDAAREFCTVIERTAQSSARVVLLTGNGPRFCAGGDVASMVAAEDQANYLRVLAETLEAGLRSMSELPVPVVAAVQGAVAGAGLAVILNADVVVAAKPTKFLTAYAGIGLTPDCGVSYLLPRAIGQQRALELALTGRVIAADEALAWGLIDRREIAHLWHQGTQERVPMTVTLVATVTLSLEWAILLGITIAMLVRAWARRGAG